MSEEKEKEEKKGRGNSGGDRLSRRVLIYNETKILICQAIWKMLNVLGSYRLKLPKALATIANLNQRLRLGLGCAAQSGSRTGSIRHPT